MYVCMHVGMQVCVCVCIYKYVRTHMYMYDIRMSECGNVRMYAQVKHRPATMSPLKDAHLLSQPRSCRRPGTDHWVFAFVSSCFTLLFSGDYEFQRCAARSYWYFMACLGLGSVSHQERRSLG